MAGVWMRMMLFNSFFMSGLSFDIHLVKVHPKQAISGVTQVSVGDKYGLNASAARDLCERLGLTIASKAQVAEAQRHGLETCRFGWIDEQIAVIPRVQVNPNCGKGKTGVVVWRTDLGTQFDVFCFNLADFEAQNQPDTTADPRPTRKPITTRSSVFPTSHLRKSPSSPLGSLSSSVPSHSPSENHVDDDRKHLPMSGTPKNAVPAALLITVTFTVMLAVFLTLYYFKTNRPCRTRCDGEQQKKEYVETEVWKQCSNTDLQKPQEEHVEENEEENTSGRPTDQD